MDEFLSIALWIMIGFIAINVMVTAFNLDTTISSNGLGLSGVGSSSAFNESDVNAYSTSVCDTSSSSIFSYPICYFNQLVSMAFGVIDHLGSFMTNWITLLNVIFLPFGSYGTMFVNMLVPFLGLTELIAILLLVMKLAAVARGVIGL